MYQAKKTGVKIKRQPLKLEESESSEEDYRSENSLNIVKSNKSNSLERDLSKNKKSFTMTKNEALLMN